MEPRIQYAHTKDGVSIAFQTLGNGMPPIAALLCRSVPHRTTRKGRTSQCLLEVASKS